MIGETILHYKIIEKLGGGGMGIVYKAEDIKLHRTVALKFLPPELTRDEEAKKRFINEAQAASSLQHNNVCNIHDIDETVDGQIFICMDCYDGETLKEKISRGPLKLDIAINISIQIAEGLQKANENGIIHRDIKPANIFITNDGIVKIIDFGLAKLSGRTMMTKMGSTLGTVAYMSPEQARGEEVDQRTDIWSLGVVLYEMITGKLPFKGDYDQAIIYGILNEEPQPIARFNEKVTPEIEHIVAKALEKDRDERYQHVDELLADLRRELKKLEYAKAGYVTTFVPTLANTKSNWKRIGSTVLVFGILVGISIYFFISKSKPIDSMAVLPFISGSMDTTSEYLSDGFTESLINILSKLPGMKMMSSNSVFRFKGKEIDPQKAASELGVAAVLAGHITQRGDNLSISVELINAKDNSHIWGDRYNRKLSDVIALQTEISQEISNQLKITLTSDEQKRLMKPATDNTEAYRLYLKGRFYWKKRSKEGFEKAIQCFNQAIEKDPSYALAFAGLADVYMSMGSYFFLTPKEWTEKAGAAARKALTLDETLAEPHATITALFEANRDWENAEREYKRCLELDPNYATGHQWYGEFLSYMGRFNEGLIEIRKAQELDPLSPVAYYAAAYIPLTAMHRYDEAIQEIKKLFEIDQNFPLGHTALGLLYFLKGKSSEAIKEMKRAIELSDSSLEFIANLGYIYGFSGQRQEAEKILRKFLQLEKQQYVSPYLIGELCLGIGEKDQAFLWFNLAAMEDYFTMERMKTDPIFDPIRGDPRFAELLKKVGLPQ
jgi:serine/threonine protein kinase/Tfp pilus assembly protein PilF